MAKAAKKPAKRAAVSRQADAAALLRADHKLVSGLFADYAKARSAEKKQQLVTRICAELSVHAQIEEEIFYPAVKRALKDKVLVPEATVEHASLKALIARIEAMEPGSEMFEATVKVLSEYVEHHVKEEQNEMFPKANAARLDMVALGARMAKRKTEILEQRSALGDPVIILTAQPMAKEALRRGDGAALPAGWTAG